MSEEKIAPIKTFTFEGNEQPVIFGETLQVNDFVECDTYAFENDPTKDLGIIRVKHGGKTPLQKVLSGERTVEGYVSGKGILKITRGDGKTETYEVSEKQNEKLSVNVNVGDLMQWQADKKFGS